MRTTTTPKKGLLARLFAWIFSTTRPTRRPRRGTGRHGHTLVCPACGTTMTYPAAVGSPRPGGRP